jgi:hypothetical protein
VSNTCAELLFPSLHNQQGKAKLGFEPVIEGNIGYILMQAESNRLQYQVVL